MNALDISKVDLYFFKKKYISFSFLFLLVCSCLENFYFSLSELQFTKGVFWGLLGNFILTLIKMESIKNKSKKSVQIFLFLSIFGIFIYFLLLYFITENFSKNLPLYGFLLAYNLHILFIVLITNYSTKS
jgi:uncharacterized membrane protein YbhN (UPF0104 family)